MQLIVASQLCLEQGIVRPPVFFRKLRKLGEFIDVFLIDDHSQIYRNSRFQRRADCVGYAIEGSFTLLCGRRLSCASRVPSRVTWISRIRAMRRSGRYSFR